MENPLAFVLAALALAGSPGPATLSLAAAGAAFGVRLGLGYLAGIVVGMLGVIAIAATGAVGLVLALPGAAPVVTLLAAAYFIWLAWRIATAPPLEATSAERRPPSFAGGALLSLVNPKGYAAMAALFSGFVVVRGGVALDSAAKAAALTVLITAVNVAWLFAGAGLTRLFRDARTNRIINRIFAALLLASVAATLTL
jgi:threonine/homoserine/homoserine lactone efflux protein